MVDKAIFECVAGVQALLDDHLASGKQIKPPETPAGSMMAVFLYTQ